MSAVTRTNNTKQSFYHNTPYDPYTDIDECNDCYKECTSIEGSMCYNTIGSYECVCPPDYTLCYESSKCIRKLGLHSVLKNVLHTTKKHYREIIKSLNMFNNCCSSAGG